MGVLIDTGVFIRWERLGRAIDLSRWNDLGESAVSVITASELLVGVYRANSVDRSIRRQQFIEGVLGSLTIVDVDLATARTHASISAALAAKGTPIGPHDLWIAATAIRYGFAVLTTNSSEFSRVENLRVVEFSGEG